MHHEAYNRIMNVSLKKGMPDRSLTFPVLDTFLPPGCKFNVHMVCSTINQLKIILF
jgi:hypothetical protein